MFQIITAFGLLYLLKICVSDITREGFFGASPRHLYIVMETAVPRYLAESVCSQLSQTGYWWVSSAITRDFIQIEMSARGWPSDQYFWTDLIKPKGGNIWYRLSNCKSYDTSNHNMQNESRSEMQCAALNITAETSPSQMDLIATDCGSLHQFACKLRFVSDPKYEVYENMTVIPPPGFNFYKHNENTTDTCIKKCMRFPSCLACTFKDGECNLMTSGDIRSFPAVFQLQEGDEDDFVCVKNNNPGSQVVFAEVNETTLNASISSELSCDTGNNRINSGGNNLGSEPSIATVGFSSEQTTEVSSEQTPEVSSEQTPDYTRMSTGRSSDGLGRSSEETPGTDGMSNEQTTGTVGMSNEQTTGAIGMSNEQTTDRMEDTSPITTSQTNSSTDAYSGLVMCTCIESNVTVSSSERQERIRRLLLVPRTSLSSFKRQKISVNDDRKSSAVMGWSAGIILTTPCVLIVMSDLANFLK